jgi:hypothetical protein
MIQRNAGGCMLRDYHGSGPLGVARAEIRCISSRMSLLVTNRTNRTGLTMSVDRGRAEVVFRGRQDRL